MQSKLLVSLPMQTWSSFIYVRFHSLCMHMEVNQYLKTQHCPLCMQFHPNRFHCSSICQLVHAGMVLSAPPGWLDDVSAQGPWLRELLDRVYVVTASPLSDLYASLCAAQAGAADWGPGQVCAQPRYRPSVQARS